MADAAIRLEREGALAVVTLARPAVKNSLRLADIAELDRLLAAIAEGDARALLLRGDGGAFCAGRDLKETDPERDDTLAILRDCINPVIQRLAGLPIPAVAAVQGPALGLGLGLALACDVTYVADDAILGSPFRNIGAILDSGGHHFLARRIGPHRAMELILGGRLITGREAAALGMVNRAVAGLDLDRIARDFALAAGGGPTAAFRVSKAIIAADGDLAATLALEATGQDAILRTRDAREGIRAFQEKRKPAFVGS